MRIHLRDTFTSEFIWSGSSWHFISCVSIICVCLCVILSLSSSYLHWNFSRIKLSTKQIQNLSSNFHHFIDKWHFDATKTRDSIRKDLLRGFIDWSFIGRSFFLSLRLFLCVSSSHITQISCYEDLHYILWLQCLPL